MGLRYQVFHQTLEASLADKCLRAGEQVFDQAKTSNVGTQQITSAQHLLPRGRVARRPGVGSRRAERGAPSGNEPPVRLASDGSARLPEDGGEVGERVHPGTHRRIGHVQPLRRERPGPPRAVPGDGRCREPHEPGRDARRTCCRTCGTSWIPPSRAPGTIRSATGAFRWDPVPHAFGLALEALGYHRSRRRSLRRHLEASARLGARRERVGDLVRGGRRFDVPRVHAPSGREPGRRARRHGSAPPMARRSPVRTARSPATGSSPTRYDCPPNGGNAFKAFDQANWRYVDRVSSWSTVEPSLDYTALSMLTFVRLEGH